MKLSSKEFEEDIVRQAHTFLPVDLEGREEFLQYLEKALQHLQEEARREVVERIKSLRSRQIEAYGDKLPFVMFEGKADEKEKITIYEQAFKDILQSLEETE